MEVLLIGQRKPPVIWLHFALPFGHKAPAQTGSDGMGALSRGFFVKFASPPPVCVFVQGGHEQRKGENSPNS